MGPSVFAGVGVLIGMLPLNAFIARRAGRFQKQNMSHKDSRMKVNVIVEINQSYN